MNDLTAADAARIHEINHDTRRAIACQESEQHHQMSFGQLSFPDHVSFLGLLPFSIALVQVV